MEILNNGLFESLYARAVEISGMLKVDKPTGTEVLEGILAACVDAGKKDGLGIGIVKDAWPNKIVAAADVRGNSVQLVIMSHSNTDKELGGDSFKVESPRAEPTLKDLPTSKLKEKDL
jgi:hypothetical protein